MSEPFELMDRLPEIGRRIDQAGSIYLGFDFDGTLTPIRPWPEEVSLAPPVREALRQLARSPSVTVMIVSGRSLSDVMARVNLPEVIYAGNHGLEIRGPGIEFVEPTAAALARSLSALNARLETCLRDIPGALVEKKGLGTSVHTRNVEPDLRGEVERIVAEVAAGDADRFIVTAGRRIREIRPRVSWNKGTAVRWVLDRLGGPEPRADFFLGDDRTDEDAFEHLPEGITVKVGDARPTRARFAVQGPAEVERFLEWLLARLAVAGKPPAD